MGGAKDKDRENQKQIVGLGYDGRRDRHTRAMVEDCHGKKKMRMITEEHESVTEEPSGKYLGHFAPEPPVGREKPAMKVAQGLLNILEQNSSTNSYHVLGRGLYQHEHWVEGRNPCPPGGTPWKETLLGHLHPPHQRASPPPSYHLAGRPHLLRQGVHWRGVLPPL